MQRKLQWPLTLEDVQLQEVGQLLAVSLHFPQRVLAQPLERLQHTAIAVSICWLPSFTAVFLPLLQSSFLYCTQHLRSSFLYCCLPSFTAVSICCLSFFTTALSLCGLPLSLHSAPPSCCLLSFITAVSRIHGISSLFLIFLVAMFPH